jgi:integrase/recombinase XerD
MEGNLEIYKNRYKQHLEILNRTPRTIEEYMLKLGHFVEFLKQIGVGDIELISKQHIESYRKEVYYKINTRNGKQNTVFTQNTYLTAVKSFFIYLRNEGYITFNPAKDLPYAKTPRQLPRVILSEREIQELFKQPDTHNFLEYRDKTILEVLYSTGIRRSELLNLKPHDIDYAKGFLRVNKGKGNKDRVVPLGKVACRYLENYIKLVRDDFVRKTYNNSGNRTDAQYLFLTIKGNKMSAQALKQMIHKYTIKARINKRITPHVFRHTFATHMLQQKANIRCVQEILGHMSLDTTQRYTRITIADLKEAHRCCHPREKEAVG